jgi:hypothetical protein
VDIAQFTNANRKTVLDANGKEQLRNVRWANKGCAFWECAEEKNVKWCFLCKNFLCQLHYRKEAVYTQEELSIWKELIKRIYFW